MWAPAVLCAAALLAAAAAWTDWRHRQVPNALAASLAGLWLLALPVAPAAFGTDPWTAAACGAAGLGVGFACYAFGWFGAGDGKLLAVLALWLGPVDVAFAALAASVLLLGLLLPAAVGSPARRRRSVPVACALAPPAAVLIATRAWGLA